ncbi:hypothetical protein [Cryptosporidium hominis TU502]|uniref:hypothetical protein n=1 Tax=Cryptosporidium hominis (strain TU502) TaxID=353151 RepID=UPI0000453547|nr:hypothetical protein [Cryptosporidium hominis TU502]
MEFTRIQAQHFYLYSPLPLIFEANHNNILTLIASHGVGISRISIDSRRESTAIFLTGILYFLNALIREYIVYLRSKMQALLQACYYIQYYLLEY